VELPTGTSLDTTTKVVEAVAADVRQNATGVTATFTTIGGGTQGQVNQGRIQVVMKPRVERAFNQEALMAWARTRFAGVEQAKISATPISPFGGDTFRNQPIQLNVRGSDMQQLIDVTNNLKAELAKVPGMVDLDTTHRGGKPEVEIVVDRERAADLGVPVASVASTIRAMIAADAVSELKDGVDVYDIVLQLPPQRKRSSSSNRRCARLWPARGPGERGAGRARRGTSQIERQARQRQITVPRGSRLAARRSKKIDERPSKRAMGSPPITPAWRRS
jgi:HAE1 family hydrophobic/amphiphilic exporter-1